MDKPDAQNDLTREELESAYPEPSVTPRIGRLLHMKLDAIDVFREHQLIPPSTMPLMYTGRSRWVMQHINSQARKALIAKTGEAAKYTGPKYVEIICLMCGELYVGGELDPVIFGGGEEGNELLRLAWIGRNWDVDNSVRESAIKGMRDNGVLTNDYDEAVARHEVGMVIERYQNEKLPMKPWEEMLALDPFYSYDNLIRVALGYGCIDHSALPRWGTIVSRRVLLAWAAVRRLCILVGM